MSKNNKPGLLARIFAYHGDRANDAPEEDTSPTIRRYFKLLGRRFWKLISLNILMLPMVIPVAIVIYVYFLGSGRIPAEDSVLFSQLYGAGVASGTPQTAFLLDLFGGQFRVPVYGTGTYVIIAICALFLLVTFGWQNIGTTFVLRSMVRGEPVFIFSDYFYAIKRNWKQGLFLGMIDFLFLCLSVYDFLYFWNMAGTSFATDLMFWGICAVSILYFFMRFYIYLMQITFDLSIRKILKNALIFTAIGIKRNIMGLVGIALVTAVNLLLFPLFTMTPLGIAIPLILPLIYYFAVCAFTAAYAAYPIIDRYMIAPYSKQAAEKGPVAPSVDAE